MIIWSMRVPLACIIIQPYACLPMITRHCNHLTTIRTVMQMHCVNSTNPVKHRLKLTAILYQFRRSLRGRFGLYPKGDRLRSERLGISASPTQPHRDDGCSREARNLQDHIPDTANAEIQIKLSLVLSLLEHGEVATEGEGFDGLLDCRANRF